MAAGMLQPLNAVLHSLVQVMGMTRIVRILCLHPLRQTMCCDGAPI